ncbi:hypothetical protein DL771_012230 [Monosporascus sp. 5C6A]|nr:hypothetical protein DL771_012230 [Monosporascus sp. 5C6A]
MRGTGKSNRVAFYRSDDSKADKNVTVKSSGNGRLRRLETSLRPFDDKHDRVKCLDAGDGSIGGMNNGIYVVRKKITGQLFVKKNYNGAVPYLIPLIRS